MAASVILLIVDNPAHRVLFNRHLKSSPHHLVFATDGEDGFDRFAEVKPDLVMIHLNVARLDGTILCQLLRQEPRGEAIPIVLLGEELTDREVARRRVAAVGADAFLPSPVSPAVLLECITPLLAFGRPRPGTGMDHLFTRPPLVERVEADFGAVTEFTDASSRSAGRGPAVGPEPASPGALESTDAPPGSVGRGPAVVRDPAPLGSLELTDAPFRSAGSLEFAERTARQAVRDEDDDPSGPAAVRELDLDTVVSFKNPFFEGAVITPGVAMVSEGLGHDEQPTPVGRVKGAAIIEPELVREEPVTSVSMEMDETGATALGLTPALEEPRAEPITEGNGKAPSALELGEAPSASPIEEQSLPAPKIDALLEEPPISTGGAGADDLLSTKAKLIEEVPRELTPSDGEEHRGSALRRAMQPGGVRRGLDESQLGKRLAKRVRGMFGLLEEVDHYQLLGIEVGASRAQIRDAYFELSLEFHPDRFFLLRSGDLKEKIYAIYRRVAEAHRVLSDPRLRAAYDQARQSGSSKVAAREHVAAEGGVTAGTTAPVEARGELEARASTREAEALVARARAAWAEGDLDGARLFLHLARAYERDNETLERSLATVVRQVRPAL